MNTATIEAMKLLKANRNRLTQQQIRTLKGQALAGDPAGAIKGLRKILEHRKINKTEEKTS